MNKAFWWGDQGERDLLQDLDIDRRIILKLIFKMWDGGAWDGLIWLMMETGGRCFSMR